MEIAGGFAPFSAYPFRAGYTAVFENAVLEFNTQAANTLVLSTDSESKPITLPAADGYQLEMESFARALHGEDVPYCSVAEAAEAVLCCKTIMNSL